ncbi:hypothetical protein ACJX0J_023890, partial [Zea mays]
MEYKLFTLILVLEAVLNKPVLHIISTPQRQRTTFWFSFRANSWQGQMMSLAIVLFLASNIEETLLGRGELASEITSRTYFLMKMVYLACCCRLIRLGYVPFHNIVLPVIVNMGKRVITVVKSKRELYDEVFIAKKNIFSTTLTVLIILPHFCSTNNIDVVAYASTTLEVNIINKTIDYVDLSVGESALKKPQYGIPYNYYGNQGYATTNKAKLASSDRASMGVACVHPKQIHMCQDFPIEWGVM